MMLICKTCNIEKDEQVFYLRKDTNKRRAECKLCRAIKDKQKPKLPHKPRYIRRLELKELEKQGLWRCASCLCIKTITECKKGYCKLCNVAWYTKNKSRILQKQKENHHIKTYGISLKDLGTYCCICKISNDLVIDHCHISGKNRGVLCRQCNAAIGLFKEDKVIIAKAVEYLNAFED